MGATGDRALSSRALLVRDALRRILLFAGLIIGAFLGYALFADAAHAADKGCCAVAGPLGEPIMSVTHGVGSTVQHATRAVPGTARAVQVPRPLAPLAPLVPVTSLTSLVPVTPVAETATKTVERTVTGVVDRGATTLRGVVPGTGLGLLTTPAAGRKPPWAGVPLPVAAPTLANPLPQPVPPASRAAGAEVQPDAAKASSRISAVAGRLTARAGAGHTVTAASAPAGPAQWPPAPASPGTPMPASAAASTLSAANGGAHDRSPEVRGAAAAWPDPFTPPVTLAATVQRLPSAAAIRPGVRPD